MRSHDLLLAVLGTMDRQRVEGRTRFMQLAFLLVHETDVDVEYEFRRRNYGPYSDGVHDDLERLDEEGLIDIRRTTTDSGNVKYEYAATGRGEEEAEAVLNELERHEADAVVSLAENYGDMPIFILLDHVYREYPEFAEKRAA